MGPLLTTIAVIVVIVEIWRNRLLYQSILIDVAAGLLEPAPIAPSLTVVFVALRTAGFVLLVAVVAVAGARIGGLVALVVFIGLLFWDVRSLRHCLGIKAHIASSLEVFQARRERQEVGS